LLALLLSSSLLFLLFLLSLLLGLLLVDGFLDGLGFVFVGDEGRWSELTGNGTTVLAVLL